MEFPDTTRLDAMLPALLQSVGGVETLEIAKRQVSPEFLEFDIAMWIKDSEEQEGGAIDASTIEALARLGATLSFGFYNRHDT